MRGSNPSTAGWADKLLSPALLIGFLEDYYAGLSESKRTQRSAFRGFNADIPRKLFDANASTKNLALRRKLGAGGLTRSALFDRLRRL